MYVYMYVFMHMSVCEYICVVAIQDCTCQKETQGHDFLIKDYHQILFESPGSLNYECSSPR